MQLLATTTMGFEAVVAHELLSLGYEPQNIGTGRTLFKGDEKALCRSNVWLRTAGRVLLVIGEFEARDFDELFDRTYELPWERWISMDGAFPVSGRTVKSQLSSVPACQKIVKKSIAEKLKASHRIKTLTETGPVYEIEVSLLKDKATLVIDTSGTGLHRRGYRTMTGTAPLRETLAAGLVLLSYWNPERALWDPFCGTGTIPIEAALIGRNIAPGLNRQFGAESWPQISPDLWNQAREEAKDLIKPPVGRRIIGSDIDEKALRLAQFHARKAGVFNDIIFHHKPFNQLTKTEDYGVVITNPPYAERLGDEREVRLLYASMPEVFRKLKTWSFYVLTPINDFETILGQNATRRRKLYNARLECTYYQFIGPKPGKTKSPEESIPSAFGGLSERAPEQAEFFLKRLIKKERILGKWARKNNISCYRLYDRDIPEIPLVVDRYESSLHIAEYQRDHGRSLAQQADWLELMGKAASEALIIPPHEVFTKQRMRQRGNLQYERLTDKRMTRLVHEGGLCFEINLSDYLDTGLFLDHRKTRNMIRMLARGKKFLNLFCYTGSASVYAAAGGAIQTTSVDLSKNYLEWAKRNMALNGFSGKNHLFISGDVPGFLKTQPKGAKYDLVFVDPPTFSNSKKLDEFWDIQRDHTELLNRLLKLLEPEGIIFFSCNFKRFKLCAPEIEGVSIVDITQESIPEDFKERRSHRLWKIYSAWSQIAHFWQCILERNEEDEKKCAEAAFKAVEHIF